MKDITRILIEANWKPSALAIMPIREDWEELGLYAETDIKPAYELVFDVEGLYEFTHYFLIEYSEMESRENRKAIEKIVFPLYNTLTGRNFDSNLIAL